MKPRPWEEPPVEHVLLGVCVALERRIGVDRGILRAAFAIPGLLGLVGAAYAATHCGPCTVDEWVSPALGLAGLGGASALVYVLASVWLPTIETPLPPPTEPR